MGLRIFRCPRIGEPGEKGVCGAVSQESEMEIRTDEHTTVEMRFFGLALGTGETMMDLSLFTRARANTPGWKMIRSYSV